MSIPASAGPALRAELKTTALSPSALVKYAGGTDSDTIDARDGS